MPFLLVNDVFPCLFSEFHSDQQNLNIIECLLMKAIFFIKCLCQSNLLFLMELALPYNLQIGLYLLSYLHFRVFGMSSLENLQNWITDEKARDLFVTSDGDVAQVSWNDAGVLKPELIYCGNVS